MPRIMQVVDSTAFPSPGAFAAFVKHELVGITAVNRLHVRARRVPLLYKSGVRFKVEPPGVETFVDAVTCYQARAGDCAHLATWRCAELQERGINAALRISWRTNVKRNDRLFHVTVRLPRGNYGEPIHYDEKNRWWFIDPSLVLGMAQALAA
jgi:hypothetical protein